MCLLGAFVANFVASCSCWMPKFLSSSTFGRDGGPRDVFVQVAACPSHRGRVLPTVAAPIAESRMAVQALGSSTARRLCVWAEHRRHSVVALTFWDSSRADDANIFRRCSTSSSVSARRAAGFMNMTAGWRAANRLRS